jgi:hypothetical protein
MKKLLFLVTFLSVAIGYGQISITGTGAANTYSQDFNTLAITATSSSVPTGWAFSETGSGFNTLYSAGTGSGTGGDTYSFGTAASTERAFGGLLSGSVTPTIGASFTNNTGATITELVISYKGETWRIGAINRSDRLDFQYSVNASSLTTGTWIDDNTLDYANPGQAATANGTQIHTSNLSSTVSGLGIVNGATFWIRWSDFNTTGADDGMAIDDFSMYVNGGGATAPEINIKGNNVSIVDGAAIPSLTNHTLFGTVATNTGVTRTYTIENLGSADLVLTSPFVQLTLGSTQYTITQPTLTTIPVGGSTTFAITFNSATGGTFLDGIEVLSNDADEANYSYDISATAEVPTPEINIRGNFINIVDGATTPLLTDHTSFGTLATGTSITRTYTIQNTGTGDLVLTAPFVQLGTASALYTITQPVLTTIPSLGSTTFSVAFSSATAGNFDNTIEVLSNDADENPYSFAITAEAVVLNFQAGDISFAGVTTDSDVFSFVNWVAIPVNAQLSFTDNAFEAGALKSNENTLVWRNNTGSPIQPGTVIMVTCPSTGAATTDLGTVISGSLNGLAVSNENVFIYEGIATAPNFIYGFSNTAWITTGTVTNSNSYLPPALNVTNGNIVTGTLDNYEYSGSRSSQIAIALYKSLVNNSSNWTGNDTIFSLSSTDFAYTPFTTEVISPICGSTLATPSSLVGVRNFSVSRNVTAYRFKATGPSGDLIIVKNTPHFQFSQLVGWQYNTTYTVSCELQVGGVWLGYYGPTCTISTPEVVVAGLSQIVSPACNSVVRPNTIIATSSLNGVTGYLFRVTNTTPSYVGANAVQTEERTSHWFRLNMLDEYVYGSTYTVEVAVKTSGAYGAFGPACTFSTTTPVIAQCATTVNSGSLISSTSLGGVTQYSYVVTNLSDDSVQTITRTMPHFPTSLITGYSSTTTYTVSVSVTSTGVQSPYTEPCEINVSAPAARLVDTTSTSELKVQGFPNPFTNNFTLEITKASEEKVAVMVYDMIGKLLDRVEVNATDNTLELGANYPAGVYNVIVSQGEKVETVRMIKR